ncbi:MULTISPECIES: high frequency lysogenization protein HflD [Oleiagrimonas]|uniref:High frequency lysogenization protein HflD homolog n=1 Tax=Oleiagrimonas citrea TaxID=1665687 RepID=A0A846ZP48_9GAMM|nr:MULTISPECIES: high frequency lysogenization protein HflD [Oleiagrimonas]NKZ39221.1 high frequency lysogenization protein HflD [Oleiagrimonas citrea]RAP57815.1 lysogenization regulator HflD [Oleiagrimonas sp. MCCC 1A03011]
MNEDRVLALAGVFQGCALAHQLATRGSCDETALEHSLASIFRIDADSVPDVFGGIAGARMGLRTLTEQFDDTRHELAIARMAVTVLRVERTLSGRQRLVKQLQEGIVQAQRQADHFGCTHATVTARLADLYTATISTLRPRVMVSGSPLLLQQQNVVERIRASLLAAVRAAVLWRQIGGRQWQLIFKRKQAAMLARGLLTGATLDSG